MLCKFSVLDGIGVGLFTAGVLCVPAGLLPAAQAEDNLQRIAPLLLFLASVIVLAKLVRQAQVFDVIATRILIMGQGNYLALFLFCVAFACLITIFLNLDTTAVLLTPVLLALARKARIDALSLAMTMVWLTTPRVCFFLFPISPTCSLLIGGTGQENGGRKYGLTTKRCPSEHLEFVPPPQILI